MSAMGRSHTGLKWAGLIICCWSSHSFAQATHPAQTLLEGLWEPEGRGSPETLLDYEAEGLLTAEAEAFRTAWEIARDDTALCQRKIAAALGGLEYGFSLEFLVKEDAIYMIGFEQIRRVYMDGRERPAAFWPNKHGWSEGQWEGDTLVVKTTDFTEGTMDAGDRPLPFGGPDAEMIERYSLSVDAGELILELSLTDPKYYVSPMNVRHRFVRSDQAVLAPDCIPTVY